MFWVNLHAVALLALPLVTCVVCLRKPRRRPSDRQMAIAAIIAGGTSAVVLSVTAHLCQAGNPISQCIMVGACIWIVLAYLNGEWTRAGIFVVMIGIMFFLANDYVDLVHEKEWVGNVQHLAAWDSLMEAGLAKTRDKVRQVGDTDDTVHPEGWLRALPIGTFLKGVIGDDLPYREESHRVWHTWLTSLFHVTTVSQNFWYPGGRPSDAAANIVLKDVS